MSIGLDPARNTTLRLPRAGLLKRLEKDLVDPPIQFLFGVLWVVWVDSAGKLFRHGADEL